MRFVYVRADIKRVTALGGYNRGVCAEVVEECDAGASEDLVVDPFQPGRFECWSYFVDECVVRPEWCFWVFAREHPRIPFAVLAVGSWHSTAREVGRDSAAGTSLGLSASN